MGKPPPIGGPIIIMIWSEPGEVKHLSTQRKRKQQRVTFRSPDASDGWKVTLAIP